MSLPDLKIRIAIPEDLDALQALVIETFTATYRAHNKAENFNQYINTSFNKNQLAKELSHPQSIFFLIEKAQKVIAYLKVNEGAAQTDYQQQNKLEIERIYVLTAHKGQGIGRLMIEKSIEVAQAKNKESIWLGVWEKNPAAIAFYKKMGFQVIDTHHFVLGDEQQLDFVMELKI